MKKLNYKKISRVFVILFTICIIGTIITYIMVKNQKITYEEVECVVTKVEQKRNFWNKVNKKRYVITVSYSGREYELENTYHSQSSMYGVGVEISAYIKNDKLYANKAGVKTSTIIAKIYFAFLFSSIIAFGGMITFIDKNKKQNKK